MTAISTGTNSKLLCHRCGWPFPNPHPSARHRRAHKKVCGTIEGYKIIGSEEHDHHLACSDVEQGLDEDERTPNPKALKKAVGEFGSSSSGIGGKSSISENDVFSDAVTEFSDSGTCSQLEECFESVRELDLSLEQKSFEADFGRSQTLYFDTTADITEQVNGPRRSAQGASVGILTGLQPDLVETGIARDDVAVDNISEYGNGKSLEGHMNDKSPPVSLESEENRIPDPALSADGSKEELCDKSDSDVVKHYQNEAHQRMDASAEISDSIKTVGEIAPFVETRERDISVRAEEVFYSNVDIVSIAADVINTSPEESLLRKLEITEQSEAKPVASSIDKEFKLEIHVAGGDMIPGNSGPSEGGLSANENWNLEKYKDNFSVDTVAYNAFECGDGDDRVLEKNVVSQSEENPICLNLGTTNEKGEGASVEVQSTVDPTNSADFPSSADLYESFKTESKDNGFDKPLEGLGADNFTEEPQPVSDITGDVSDINYSPPNSIHATTGNDGVESVDVGIITELKDDNSDDAVEVESQITPEQQKSELLSKDDITCISSKGSAGVSEESIDAIQVKAKLHDDYEDSPREQESSSMIKKGLNGADGAELTSLSDVVVDVGNKSLQTNADDKLTSHKVGIGLMDLSANNSNSRSDSLEVNCGSISGALGTGSQNPEATTEEANAKKSEIEMANNNESEGRRKDDEMIGKVSPMRRYSSLKKLLDEEVTLPNASHAKAESDGSKVGVKTAVAVAGASDEKDTKVKGVEQWNSLARYSTEVKKEKRKGKSYWIPFVCCSSPINTS